jgi:hypothetical protein
LDDLETTIHTETNPAIQAWDEEYTRNVTNQIYTPPTYGGWNTPAVGEPKSLLNMGEANETGLTGKRPPGMTKREWKRMKRGLQVAQELSPIEVDVYGFDQDERLLLAQEGWTDGDIDYCVDKDFTPSEIITCAQYGLIPNDLYYLLGQAWTPSEIVAQAKEGFTANPLLADDDVPVADRKYLS